jgi:hypothetical protein
MSYTSSGPLAPDREACPGCGLFPADHGEGRPVIAGVNRRLMTRLADAGGAIRPSLRTGYTVPFDPEAFKLAALDLLDEAGVDYLFHAFAASVLGTGGTGGTGGGRGKGRVDGVVFETKSGPVVVRSRVVVDCTGDGDVAAQAGADFEVGREDGLVQPATLMFRIGEFARAGFEAYVREHPDQWASVHGLWDLVRRAAEAGELDLPREDILMFGTPHAREILVNSTRVLRVLGTDVWDLTRAEREGRLQMRAIAAFFRRYVPGFEESYVIESGPQVGIRESRRVMGEYVLTADDVLAARKFDDVVARGTYPIDVHSPTGKGTVLKRVPAGEAYDIPLRCLLPRGADNLLVAGRCISGTHEAHSSYRVMPIATATGQAAGVCAALAARAGISPRDVPAARVQAELLRQGANLRDVRG